MTQSNASLKKEELLLTSLTTVFKEYKNVLAICEK